MKLGGGGGEAYLKLKRYERVVFYRFSKRGYALYKAGWRGGRAIKLAGKLCPVLCMFGFNCSVPKACWTYLVIYVKKISFWKF